jgi:chemotaxis methyl-accepting protein methylase
VSNALRLELLAERIRAYAGLDPPAWLLEARVLDRASLLKLDTRAYLKRAIGDDAVAGRELEVLSEMLRVGETRFFRHRPHVAALKARLIPERARAAQLAGRPLRGWSAGCATGEEAWTLAMLMDEASTESGPVTRGFEVLGTDLSDDALERARAGLYSTERLADVPAELRSRHFDPAQPSTIGSRLRRFVRFERHNLLSPRYPGPFDLVLCRNVLIYFDAETRAEVIVRLAQALHPGGYLFLGYSETLRDHLELFEQVRDDEGLVYRRRDESVSQRRELPLNPASASEPGHASDEILVDKPIATPSRLILRGDYHDGARLADELKPVVVGAQHTVVDLDGAEFLGDEAARVLQRAVQAAPGLELAATRPSVKRWLHRHGLVRR